MEALRPIRESASPATRAMRLSAADAGRQLGLSLWLAGILVIATIATATFGVVA